MSESKWRVGSKIRINVYEGDRPVCQCHTAVDARRIVAAMRVATIYPGERFGLQPESKPVVSPSEEAGEVLKSNAATPVHEGEVCECREALERLKRAGDRKVMDGSVLISAPFLDSVLDSLSAPCPCEHLRQQSGLYTEIVKRLRGAFLVAHLGEWIEWQDAIDRFMKAVQAQEHLARAASDRYDRIIELERDLCEARGGEAVYSKRAESSEAERDSLRAELEQERKADIEVQQIVGALESDLAASQERERVLREALKRLREQVSHSVMGTAGNRIDFRDEIALADAALATPKGEGRDAQ